MWQSLQMKREERFPAKVLTEALYILALSGSSSRDEIYIFRGILLRTSKD